MKPTFCWAAAALESLSQFYGIAAHLMRQILIDHA
jgi:hypothetical protein